MHPDVRRFDAARWTKCRPERGQAACLRRPGRLHRGSLTAGLAENAGWLLGGGVAQGVGAAMLSPAALSVVIRLFVGDERNRALGIWSALGGGGAAVGVLLGGLITAGPGWPWVFFINIPVGLIVLFGLLRVLPPLPPARTPQPSLDVLAHCWSQQPRARPSTL
ncbi:MFS transporter [Williamsia sp. D3]|uniref:MFS transporter n=1 Tax=Williamsia sp. D3 TaxID=1313067 RepID=UPI0021007091|nr:MFS transporter [Williamsia sp. D3]